MPAPYGARQLLLLALPVLTASVAPSPPPPAPPAPPAPAENASEPGWAAGAPLCWAGEQGATAPRQRDETQFSQLPAGADLTQLLKVGVNGKAACGIDALGDVRCWRDGSFVLLPEKARSFHVGNKLVCIARVAGGASCFHTEDASFPVHVQRDALWSSGVLRSVASFGEALLALDSTGAPLIAGPDNNMPDYTRWGVDSTTVNATKIVVGLWACMINGPPGKLMCWAHGSHALPGPLTLDLEAYDVDMWKQVMCVVAPNRNIWCHSDILSAVSFVASPENSMAPFESVHVGSQVVCGRTVAKTVACWGAQEILDVQPPSLSGVIAMGVGGRNVCVLGDKPTTTVTSTSTVTTGTSTVTTGTMDASTTTATATETSTSTPTTSSTASTSSLTSTTTAVTSTASTVATTAASPASAPATPTSSTTTTTSLLGADVSSTTSSQSSTYSTSTTTGSTSPLITAVMSTTLPASGAVVSSTSSSELLTLGPTSTTFTVTSVGASTGSPSIAIARTSNLLSPLVSSRSTLSTTLLLSSAFPQASSSPSSAAALMYPGTTTAAGGATTHAPSGAGSVALGASPRPPSPEEPPTLPPPPAGDPAGGAFSSTRPPPRTAFVGPAPGGGSAPLESATLGAPSSADGSPVPESLLSQELAAALALPPLRSSGGAAGSACAVPLLPQLNNSQHVQVADGSAEAHVPLSVLLMLGSDLAMVMASFTNVTSTEEGASGHLAMSIRGVADAAPVPVSGLREPIRFRLATNFSEGMICVFWDVEKGAWSTRGVWTDPKNAPGEPMWCSTTHLTLFAAILQGASETVECSSLLILLNKKAVWQILEGSWYMSYGAIVVSFLLLLLTVSSVIATVLDRKWSQKCLLWRDDFFLTAPEPDVNIGGPVVRRESAETVSAVSMMTSEASGRSTDRLEEGRDRGNEGWGVMPIMACSSLCCGCCCCAMGNKKGRAIILDAVEDIFSSWFAYFVEVRSFIEDFMSSLTADSGALGVGLTAARILALSKRATSNMMLMNARRAAAASMGYSEDTIHTVMKDRSLVAFLMEEHNSPHANPSAAHHFAPCVGGSAWGQAPSFASAVSSAKNGFQRRPSIVSSTSSVMSRDSQRKSWQQFRSEIRENLLAQTRLQGGQPKFIKTACMIFACQNPVGSLFVLNIFKSCKQRVLLLAAELFGSFAFCCVFFKSAGLVQGKQASLCGGASEDMSSLEHIFQRLGRFLVISIGSLLLAGLPVTILSSLQTKKFTRLASRSAEEMERRLRIWKMQGRLFWTIGLLYIGFCGFYIILFLANIEEEGQQDWSLASVWALLQDLLMLPFLTSILVPLFAKALFSAHIMFTSTSHDELVRNACMTLHRRVMMPIEEI